MKVWSDNTNHRVTPWTLELLEGQSEKVNQSGNIHSYGALLFLCYAYVVLAFHLSCRAYCLLLQVAHRCRNSWIPGLCCHSSSRNNTLSNRYSLWLRQDWRLYVKNENSFFLSRLHCLGHKGASNVPGNSYWLIIMFGAQSWKEQLVKWCFNFSRARVVVW